MTPPRLAASEQSHLTGPAVLTARGFLWSSVRDSGCTIRAMKYLRLGFAFAVVATVSASAQAQESDLMVEQSAVEQSDADTDVTFSVTVTNLGPDASDAVTLSDPLPLGMTFVSVAAAAGWNCTTPAVGNGGNVDCTVGTLAVGTPASFSIVAHIDAAAEAGTYFTNVVTASTATDPSGENDAAVATVQTPPPPSADVGVLVTGPAATNPDLDVSYVIEVINGGPEAASNVALGTALAGDMVFVSLQQESGPTFSCTTGATIDCTIASLAAGASAELTLVGPVPAGTISRRRWFASRTTAASRGPATRTSRSCASSPTSATKQRPATR